MATSADIAVGIPGDCMRDAFSDVEMAVRANPNLVVVCTSASCGLNVEFDAVFNFGALDAHSHGIQVQFGGFF